MSTITDRPTASALLYAEAVAAFDETGWRHSEPHAACVLGTVIERDGRLIGGSLEVAEGIVRFRAFGVTAAADRAPAFHALFGEVNSTLPTGSFEVDPHLGPVCRTSVDLSGAFDDAGALRDAPTVRAIVLGLAATATGLFEGLLGELDAIATGTRAARR